MASTAADVSDFWFSDHGPEDWFSGSPDFDVRVRAQLGDLHARAVRSELWEWRNSADGRLAEIILLDQVSRQLHRGEGQAFAADTMALALAQEMIAQGMDAPMDVNHKLFVYMPFQHAESLVIQEQSLRLFEAMGSDDYMEYARAHHETIARFGRFPFRNGALGRPSTPDELAYMKANEGRAY
ncbi:DUF924 family protein [Pelagibacterium montanilacus]|uniref:DUF924 family protein n=1 Tax=Pelagibacterium montanilacus TaxID=2185280 RepID=UPI000F8E5E94|nr:DUF924 family protein [Pelagibacterium montanilacus]